MDKRTCYSGLEGTLARHEYAPANEEGGNKFLNRCVMCNREKDRGFYHSRSEMRRMRHQVKADTQ